MIAVDEPTALDRIALSNELYALAEHFTLEAEKWKDPDARAQLRHDANLLATIARAMLTTADYDRGLAYADVAATAIRNVEGARRFLTAVNTPPASEGSHD